MENGTERNIKALIVEDDRHTIDVIRSGLFATWPDCKVVTTDTGEQAIELFRSEDPDLVVLDISMPQFDGLEICKVIRQQSDVTIVVVSSSTDITEKTHALDLGASDYITKPFDQSEFLVCLGVHIHTIHKHALSEFVLQHNNYMHDPKNTGLEIRSGNVRLDLNSRQVHVNGKAIMLTSIEFRLLKKLMQRPGAFITYESLLEQVWGPEYVDSLSSLKVVVWRLRRKLGEKSGMVPFIQNERGIGYRFVRQTQANNHY